MKTTNSILTPLIPIPYSTPLPLPQRLVASSGGPISAPSFTPQPPSAELPWQPFPLPVPIESISLLAFPEAKTEQPNTVQPVIPGNLTMAIHDTDQTTIAKTGMEAEKAWNRFFLYQVVKGTVTGIAPVLSFLSPSMAALVDGLGRLIGLKSDKAQFDQGTFQSQDGHREATVTKGRAAVQGVTDGSRFGYSVLNIVSGTNDILSLSLALSMTLLGGVAAGLSILSSAFSLYKYRDDIVEKIPAEKNALYQAWTALQSPGLTDEAIEGYEKKYFNVTIDGHLRSFHEVAPHIQTQYRDALATINGVSSDDPRERRIQALRNHITMQYHAQKKEGEGQVWGVLFRAALIGANISQLTLLGAGIIGFAALASNPVGWGIAGAIMVGCLFFSAIALLKSTIIRLFYRSIIKPKHHGLETLFEENNPQGGLKDRFKNLLSPMNADPTTPLDRTDNKERTAAATIAESPLLTGCA